MRRIRDPVTLAFHEGTLRLTGISPAAIGRIYSQPEQAAWFRDDREDSFRADAFRYAELAPPLRDRLSPPVDDRVFALKSVEPESVEPESVEPESVEPESVEPESVEQKAGERTTDRIAFGGGSSKRLRDDQRRACDAWTEAGRRGVIVMPTGTGKTVVAIELIRRAACSTLVVVPIRDLMYQWHARLLEETGVDAGIIGDGVHRVSPISVTTYDSAAIHMPRLGNRFRMIVFDEAHHLPGPWRSEAARMSAAPWRLGLTATPSSDPAKWGEVESLVGPVVYRDTIGQARGRTLAEYRVRRVAVPLTASERRRYRELSEIVRGFVARRRQDDPSFRWDQIFNLAAEDADARRCLRAFRLKNRIEERASGKLRVLEDLFRLHAGQPVLVFVGSNAMAREVSIRFLVPCLLSHCGKRERADLLTGFAEGTYPVLVANRVLDEGVDLPEVKVAIVLGGTASGRQAIQRLGRVLRKGSGGEATLYEVVTDQTGEVGRSRTRRRNEAYRR